MSLYDAERALLAQLVHQIADEIQVHPDWVSLLPITAQGAVENARFGALTFALCLERRYSELKQRHITRLDLMVTQPGVEYSRTLSIGDDAKVYGEIVATQALIDRACAVLPEIFMSMFEYTRHP